MSSASFYISQKYTTDQRQKGLLKSAGVIGAATMVSRVLGYIRDMILAHLFGGGERLSCADAGDTNDDGILDIADVIYLLAHLFAGGPPPQPPFPECGPDHTPDVLVCCEYDEC